MRIKREKEKALAKVGVPTHQSKDAPSVGKLGRVTSLRIFPARPQPPTISFDYSVSTLTRTFRIGKKKNKIISARSPMRERESCASSLRIGFLLAMASMRSRNLSLFYHLNARLRITNSWKKQAHSLRSHCDFFPFFLLFLRTRANVLYAAHSTIIRQRQRLFGRAIVASHFAHPSVNENYRANDE